MRDFMGLRVNEVDSGLDVGKRDCLNLLGTSPE